VDQSDDFGVESAASHEEKYSLSRPAGVEPEDFSPGDGFRQFFRLGFKMEMPSQQIFISAWEQGQRQAGGGPVNQFGRRAIAADSDQCPQFAFGMKFVGVFGGSFQIGVNRGGESPRLKHFREPFDTRTRIPSASFGIHQNQDLANVSW
jgi:hypothetical protein